MSGVRAAPFPARPGWAGVLAVGACAAMAAACLCSRPWAQAFAAAALALILAQLLFIRAAAVASRRALASLEESRRELEWLRRSQVSISERILQRQKATRLGLVAPAVAHEICNAMSYVTSNVRMLAADLAEMSNLPELLREYADDLLPSAVSGIRRVNGLVSDLGRFARGTDEEISDYDLGAEVESAVRLLEGFLKKRCRIELDQAELPLALGRPGQLRQMLVELLLNAGQSITRDGTVRVVTRLEEDEQVISIFDNGAGMTPEVLSHLFQPFFSTRAPAEGSGLGLLLARRVVTGHGGRIDIESTPGKGTRVTVRVPRVVPGAQPRPEPDPAPPGPSDTKAAPIPGAAPLEHRST